MCDFRPNISLIEVYMTLNIKAICSLFKFLPFYFESNFNNSDC